MLIFVIERYNPVIKEWYPTYRIKPTLPAGLAMLKEYKLDHPELTCRLACYKRVGEAK
jgi:hypothetical protein